MSEREVLTDVDYTSEYDENGEIVYVCLHCDERYDWGLIQNHVREEHFITTNERPVTRKRINIYTDAPIDGLSPDQKKNMLNLARKALQKQVLEEELDANWNTVTATIEPAAIGHGQTRCWMEVEVR